jgi:hypothetical protein
MCEKCAELDRRIGHLKSMIEHLADQKAVAAANRLIEEMEAEKAALHPEVSPQQHLAPPTSLNFRI